MTKPRNLKAIFGKFSGQPLKNPDRMTCDVDGVLSELADTARKNGLELRVLFPGKMHDFGANPNRVNIPVEKDSAGKLRVGKNFSIG